MKKQNLLFTLLISLSVITQMEGQNWQLPNQDTDSLSVKSFHISFDSTTKEIEIIVSTFDKLNIHHRHLRYQTSVYEIDTIALLTNTEDSQFEIRILLCDGREFRVDDPYKGKISTRFMNKKRLRMGYWSVDDETEKVLLEVVRRINELIPVKENCNKDRDLQKYTGHTYQFSKDNNGVYFSGVIMPSLNGSNSIKSRHENIQEHMDQCLSEIEEKYLFKLSYVIDEEGVVTDVFSSDCPESIREKVIACFKQAKWEPGRFGEETVKVGLTTLIGLNIDDKFKAYEERSKEPENKPKPAEDQSIITALEMSSEVEGAVFKVVEEMPEPINDHYFEELLSKANSAFPDKPLNEKARVIVEKDGSISNIEILQSTDPDIKAWLIAELKNTAKFEPGKHRGKEVRVQVIINLISK